MKKGHVNSQFKMRKGTYQDISWVGDGSDNSGGEHELFPGLGDVDNVNSFLVSLEDIWVHHISAVFSSDVGLYINVKRGSLCVHWQQS